MRRFATAITAAVLLATATLALSPAEAATGQSTGHGPNGQTLVVTPTTDLDPAGTTVNVKGSGYDLSVGIYVAFCVDQGPSQAPSPCVGGIDTTGQSSSAIWISSDPPPYGVGIARPFDPGGTFDVDLTVSAQDQNVNCLDGVNHCKIVTRADHTDAANRSADVKVDVTFATPVGPTTTTTTTTPPTTIPVVNGPNGERTASGPNGQQVTVKPANELDPSGEKVRVTGSGFDTNVGIYLAFCVDMGPSVAPTPCFGGADTSGTSNEARWISNNPPSYGVGLAQPFGPGGTFDVELTLKAQDGSINCYDATTRCVLATRADHTASSNRTADVKVPVYFEGQNASNTAVSPVNTTAPIAITPAFTG